MAKIIFLGTAAAVASKARDNTSLLLFADRNEEILIDCPGSPTAKLERIGVDFRKISHILLTHSHPDHIYGLVSLLHSQYGLKNRVELFATERVIKLVRSLRKLFNLENLATFPEVIYHQLQSRLSRPFYGSGKVCIWTFKTKHSPDSVGFKFSFKDEGVTCVYSGDTSPSRNLLRNAFDCDYLIHDCFAPQRFFKKYPQLNKMHTSSLTLGKLAKEAKVKTLVPVHFAQELKFPMQDITKEIRRNYKGRIILPKDFDFLIMNGGD